MFLPELEVLLSDGRITEVVFIRLPGYSDWEIHFKWKGKPDDIEPYLQVRSTGLKKVYTSVDRALDTLRRLGYAGNVVVQG